MSKDRIIHLLSDEEIGYILTGLRILGQRYTEQSCEDDVFFVNQLYDKVEKSLDVGVIGNERI